MLTNPAKKGIQKIDSLLGRIARRFEDIEVEELALYGDVEKRLKKAGLTCGTAYQPTCIPPGQI